MEAGLGACGGPKAVNGYGSGARRLRRAPLIAEGGPGRRDDAPATGRRCDSRSHRCRPTLSDPVARRPPAASKIKAGPASDVTSGERRLPIADRLVPFFDSLGVVRRAPVLPSMRSRRPFVWNRSTAGRKCWQGSDCSSSIHLCQPVGENGDMPLPLDDTLVSYPGGALYERAAVLHVEARHIDAAADRMYLITDRSCVHPVDPRWPDQGPDIGTI